MFDSIISQNYFILPYADYVYIAIGLGMVLSLLLGETLGVVAGGVIEPGYFALHFQDIPAVLLMQTIHQFYSYYGLF